MPSRLSLWDTRVGNLPALFKPGPNRRGICLMTVSLAKKALYFLAAQAQQKQYHIHGHKTGKPVEAVLIV